MKDFLFSVVMPIYNVELYLREAVDSILNQDIGFENVQLILVDDGSPDNCGRICEEYREKYPENILVIHKENGGQSSARNLGIKAAEGRYVTFTDPDDILEKNAFSAVFRFFEEHHEETDVVSIPVKLFGFQKGDHSLNYKFEKGSRVVDLEEEWAIVQLQIGSIFVKTGVAKSCAFEEDLHMVCAEDAREVLKILVRKKTLGVVSDTAYHYRKHPTSALHNVFCRKGRYTDQLRDFVVWALNYCRQTIGEVPQFVMYTLMYDLQWSFLKNEIPDGVLTVEETEEFQNILDQVLAEIDDSVILAQKNIHTEQMAYILARKHRAAPVQLQDDQDCVFGYNGMPYFRLSEAPLHLCFYEIRDGVAKIQAWMPRYLGFDSFPMEMYAKVNGTLIPAEAVNTGTSRCSMGIPICEKEILTFEIPLSGIKKANISFVRVCNGTQIKCSHLLAEKFFPVIKRYSNAYYYCDHYLLQMQEEGLSILRKDRLSCGYEFRFAKELWKKNTPGSRKAVFLRPLVFLLRKLIRKPIWLFADKADKADDNAEAFFEYCCREKKGENHYIFLLSKDSPDYDRIRRIGPVVPYMSAKHRLLHLLADNIISAYSHDELTNPFLKRGIHYRDLLQKCSYVFLQHGVTKDDLSANLNKFHKNIKRFVCTVSAERDSIVENIKYGYQEEEVILTGFPRFDKLYDARRKEIVIMPTWRRTLMGAYRKDIGNWDLLPGYERSPYYQFYNGLLNDEKLCAAAKQFGYRINFVPHPVMFPHADTFDVPSHVQMQTYNVKYRDAFASNALMVTDYSSTAFDFAYLRKPVIYAHFDQNHYAEGYFDYERDGFGEVEYDLKSTVSRIIEYMEHDCQLKDKYRERIDHFFAFNDKNNCQRVYQKIMEIQ